jgi:hypothetical protein
MLELSAGRSVPFEGEIRRTPREEALPYMKAKLAEVNREIGEMVDAWPFVGGYQAPRCFPLRLGAGLDLPEALYGSSQTVRVNGVGARSLNRQRVALLRRHVPDIAAIGAIQYTRRSVLLIGPAAAKPPPR